MAHEDEKGRRRVAEAARAARTRASRGDSRQQARRGARGEGGGGGRGGGAPGAARPRASRGDSRQQARRGGGAMDVFGGEVRRRDVFPLLVLHLIEREPAYGNRLIEEIEDITDGV